MTDYSPSAIAFIEPPYILSRNGAYKFSSGETITPTEPTEISYKDTTNGEGNMYVLVRYSDTAMKTHSPGPAMELKIASGTTYDRRLGSSPYRREMTILKNGVYGTIYKAGTNGIAIESAVSPYPSGCAEWRFGQALYGFTQEQAYTGSMVPVLITPFLDKIVPRVMETGITITATYVDLTKIAEHFEYIYASGAISGYLAYHPVPSGIGVLKSGQVAVIYGTTGEKALKFMVGDDAALVKVRYWYFDGK
jgi:hypothetical protein